LSAAAGTVAVNIFAIGLTGLAGEARAQAISPAETARGTTVTTRAREDFDPLGVRLDGFRLDAAAELGLGYDDNLFGTKNNRRSDGYATGGFQTNLESDWSTHRIGAYAQLEDRRYFRTSSQDWRDWSTGLVGRYDITPYTSVEAAYNHVVAHLEADDVDVQATGVSRPVQYAYDEAVLTGRTRFNRLGLEASGIYRNYRYENIDLGGPPQPPDTDPGRFSRNDFETWLGQFGTSYLLSPGRYAIAIARIQDVSHKESSQRDRDSFTWEVLGGFTYDFDGIYQGRIAVGYRQRDYEGSQFKTLSGPAFEGELIWQPTLLTTVTFQARRVIEESIRNNAVSFTRTEAGVLVDHEYLRNVILGVELRADRREYDDPDQKVTDGIAVLSARYLINRNLSVTASYEHNRRLSASSGIDEYYQNLFQIRLRVAL
jgi:hypothetical protein